MVEEFGIGGSHRRAERHLPAYYSPAMEAARPGGQRRRSRRRTVDRPLDTRLVRAASLVVAPALLALLFSVSATGALQQPPLDPVFDAEAAGAVAAELSTLYPSRVPGTLEAEDAALWYREQLSALGLLTREDVWTTDIPDLGEVELRNIVTVVPGRADETIIVVAHRDNAGVDAPFGDNASGTAALIELVRGYAPQQGAADLRPQRTLVLVSTDAGAYGGAGAARFAGESEYVDTAIAAVALDGLGGGGRPRIAIAGDGPSSAPRALVGTVAARIEEQARVRPDMPSVLEQLVDLSIPYAAGEQSSFLARGVAAVTITTSEPGDPKIPAGDPPGRLAVERFGALGRSSEALIASLDASLGAPLQTNAALFLDGRAASGWAVRLTLIVAVVPFVLGALDFLVRVRRRGLPLVPALRGIRTRFLTALYGGVVIAIAAFAGVFPTGDSLPLPPQTSIVEDAQVVGLFVAAAAFVAGWLMARQRLTAAVPPTDEECLAGYAVALTWLSAVAVLFAIAKPFALVFVLPSLYAWLWLPLQSQTWSRVATYVGGLVGPVAALLILGYELGLGPWDTALYTLGLATVGYISVALVLFALAWAAAATQLAALAFGRYAPYAGGVASPPPGPFRRGLVAVVRRRQTAT
jgi:hypothetical protein